jgi:hypothetical protein
MLLFLAADLIENSRDITKIILYSCQSDVLHLLKAVCKYCSIVLDAILIPILDISFDYK